MYTDESVDLLIAELKKEADNDYNLAKKYSNQNSTKTSIAYALHAASSLALCTVESWAAREKRDDPTPAKAEVADLRNDVEELREKLGAVREIAEAAQMSADAAQRTANKIVEVAAEAIHGAICEGSWEDCKDEWGYCFRAANNLYLAGLLKGEVSE